MRTLCLALLLSACTDPKTDAGDGKSPGPADSADPADTGDDWDPNGTIKDNCFPDVGDATASFPDYDQYGAVAGRHCSGTNHQDITDIEKVVFLGDSITAGTPPTPLDEVYQAVLTAELQARFGEDIEVADCSRYGARTDDYLPEQIPGCFPGVEDKRTLVVSTMGGNDTFAAAETMIETGSATEALAVIDEAIQHQRDAMHWFRDNEAERFPNGVFVITANIYEYTDATGDMSSCPLAEQLGFGGSIPELRDAYVYINEAFLQISVETGTDSIFMLEQFCGHGFFADDPENECYRGPEAETWFDPTCIHPNPAGHAAIAEMFLDVVLE